MRYPLIIGDKSYKYKKDALIYYQNILSFYNFGHYLSVGHFGDLTALIKYNILLYKNETPDNLGEIQAKVEEEIIVGKESPPRFMSSRNGR